MGIKRADPFVGRRKYDRGRRFADIAPDKVQSDADFGQAPGRSHCEGSYAPEADDIVWLHFDPQAGQKQAEHCPAEKSADAGHVFDIFDRYECSDECLGHHVHAVLYAGDHVAVDE